MNLRLFFLIVIGSVAAMTGRAEEAPKYWVYFGTQTGGKSSCKGIYRCEFDAASPAGMNSDCRSISSSGRR